MSKDASPEEVRSRWIVKHQPPEGGINSGFPQVIETILAGRGLNTAAEREAFLDPRLAALSDPFDLPEMDAAVTRILAAAQAGERVAIYGDYDVDGVTSLTLLKITLRHYGIDAGTFMPHRVEEGYGLSIKGLQRCIGEFSPQLVIAVDCGTTSLKEVDFLNEQSIECVILDHHEESEDGLPNCVALVNPKVGTTPPSAKCMDYLCSAGMVFKLAHALLKRKPVEGFDLKEYLDLVAVGTVADIVPLVDENRALVRRGLRELERTRNAGLAALAEVAGITPPFGALDIGFRIGPRINAAGRLGTAGDALDLLLCEDPGKARTLAAELDEYNRQRQEIERRTSDEAMEMLEDGSAGECEHGIVVGKRGWHPGVVGIVASRIARKFYRPTFVIAIDEETGLGKGSGRSVEGISLVEAINSGRELLEAGGGHAMAAGLSLHEDQLDAFRKHLNAHVREHAEPEHLIPKMEFDAECSLSELRIQLLETYARLEPFGAANPEPLLLARGVAPTSEPRVLKEKHYRLTLRQDGAVCDAIYFGGAEKELPRPPWDIAFTILRNEFRGRVSLQMNVRSVRTSEA